MRIIADSVGAFLMADMAHVSGLVAAGEHASPFAHCHVVTSTTHKTLRGPRSGMIFFRREFEDAINGAVFPALQGGPHNHQIAALAVALGEAAQEDFRAYIRRVKSNAATLAAALAGMGYGIVTGGTDNHIVLWDARATGLSGAKIERLLERLHISVNKNTLLGDVSAVSPGGIRLGTPAMTTRGMQAEHMEQVAALIDRAVKLGQTCSGQRKVVDFMAALELEHAAALDEIERDVHALASAFPLPGIEPA